MHSVENTQSPTRPKIKLGVSRCLLGDSVRFDGSHRRNKFVVDALSEYFDWEPTCPEVEAGFGTPRPTIRLVSEDDQLKVLSADGNDVTEPLAKASRRRVENLKKRGIRGFILKKDSPSCGKERVRIYRKGHPTKTGVGLFAQTLMDAWPHLPIEDEGRLNDRKLRENFMCRVYTYDRWRTVLEAGANVRAIRDFHADHKFLLLAHKPDMCRSMGRRVAAMGRTASQDDLLAYEKDLMSCLAKPARIGGHVNVLEHITGFLKRDLGSAQKADIKRVIAEYKQGRIPLVAPLILVQHHLQRLQNTWINRQVYLSPYPAALSLRSCL